MASDSHRRVAARPAALITPSPASSTRTPTHAQPHAMTVGLSATQYAPKSLLELEDLLKDVEPSKQAAAAELGAKIADQRDKAADAAKKSRDERKAKIDTLETKVSELTRLLRSIAARGGLTSTESALLVALSESED